MRMDRLMMIAIKKMKIKMPYSLGIDIKCVTIYNKNVLPIKEGRVVMSPAHGRPPSKDPKRNDTRIRLTDAEREKLEFCAEKTGMTKADIIRRGIDLVYQKITQE